MVYKVDRLTRSLLDFSKLVEAFDKAGTSFVSITQSFNTTTGMGRLTLNMLLSFAQFEREVTAERIRDKIAASKAKGMWMGGTCPLGYRPEGRTLVIVEEHAAVIRELFKRYLEIGNVRLLTQQLQAEGIKMPVRKASTGRPMGGGNFTRGQVYQILSNPTYLGEIRHKERFYPGKHDAIVTCATWDQVQAKLADNSQGIQRANTTSSASLLAGLIFDQDGEPLLASHACKGKVRYRYYVSRSLQHDAAQAGMRIPAREIETAVANQTVDLLSDPLSVLAKLGCATDPARISALMSVAEELAESAPTKDRALIRSLVSRVDIRTNEVLLEVSSKALAAKLEFAADTASAPISISMPVRLTRSGLALKLVRSDGRPVTPNGANQSMIDLLAKARRWWSMLSDGSIDTTTLADRESANPSWVSRVVRLNFLAPEIVSAILDGDHSAVLSTAALTSSGPLPYQWDEQIRTFLPT